jgi:hypothetical protein
MQRVAAEAIEMVVAAEELGAVAALSIKTTRLSERAIPGGCAARTLSGWSRRS